MNSTLAKNLAIVLLAVMFIVFGGVCGAGIYYLVNHYSYWNI